MHHLLYKFLYILNGDYSLAFNSSACAEFFSCCSWAILFISFLTTSCSPLLVNRAEYRTGRSLISRDNSAETSHSSAISLKSSNMLYNLLIFSTFLSSERSSAAFPSVIFLLRYQIIIVWI